jgi:hypothetical protein
MGVELPANGSFTFQRTFSVALQVSGRFFSSETPEPLGPRQPGQFAALAVVAKMSITTDASPALMSGFSNVKTLMFGPAPCAAL